MKLLNIILLVSGLMASSLSFSKESTTSTDSSYAHYLRSIHEFDSTIVVKVGSRKHDKKIKFPLWELDKNSGKVVPFIDKLGNPIVETYSSQDGGIKVSASRKGNAVFLRFPYAPARNKLLRIEAGKQFKIAANDQFTYLIFEDKIILIKGARVETIPLELLDIDYLSFLPRATSINKKHLYLGYNRGEFGGGVYVLDIGSRGTFTRNRFMVRANPEVISLDSQGTPWLISSLGHMTTEDARLYFLGKESEAGVIIRALGFNARTDPDEVINSGKIHLPRTTKFSGMIITNDDEVIILASSIGIISIKDKKTISYLWKDDLFEWYRTVDGFSSSSSPVGLVRLGNSLFTATTTRGVLEFSLQKNGLYKLINEYPLKKFFD